ncbi:ARMP4-like protein [Mya arenaria]|uniref:ARMP4-like protein n=1 Tax=Mya arenaria TaxID=6604 RepID=A0ABY7E7V0_MYAAR|nr:ARMP4-like protein [Mya arenaria]
MNGHAYITTDAEATVCKANGHGTNHVISKPTDHVTMAAPPGPGGPPIIGQAFNLDTDHLHLQFMEWQKRFGDLFMFKVLGKNFLVISHPDILRRMFVTCEHAKRFNDRPASFMGKYVIDKTKDIVFRKCDDEQQILKNACLEYLEARLLEETWFYTAVCQEARDLVRDLTHLEGKNVDVIAVLDRLTVKIMGLLLTGERISEAGPEFDSLQGFMHAGSELGTVKNQTLLTKLPCLRKLPGNLKDLYDKIELQKTRLRECFLANCKSDRGLIAMLRRLQADQRQESEGEAWLEDDFILGIIMDLTAAVLVHHPEIQDRIRAESASLNADVTINGVTNMPYSSACMLELKRFHTPLPISARHSNPSGAATFEKYNIPKKTEIFSNLFGIHHDERFWTDPWTYNPERFLTATGQLVPSDHPAMTNLVATGVGPRRCVGSKFSENVLHLVAATVVSHFRLTAGQDAPLPECDPRKFVPGVVTKAPDFQCVFEPV